MEGAAGWASLSLQGQEVEGPEASGQDESEEGGAGHLEKYIYILYTSIRSVLCQDGHQVWVSEWRSRTGALPPPRTNLCRARGLGQHGLCGWPSSSGEEGEIKHLSLT